MLGIFLRRAAMPACLLSAFTAAAPAAGDAEGIAALGGYVSQVLAFHPKVLAADAAVAADAAGSRGADRPLFNPSLEFEYENTDVDSATLEYSQTLDLFDKRDAKKVAADAELAVSRAALLAERERLAGEILAALADWDLASRAQQRAQERVELLQRFAALHERRAAAGDITQTDLQLAQLALAEARLQLTDVATQTLLAETGLERLAGVAPTRPLPFPDAPPAPPAWSHSALGLEALAARHPTVLQAQLRALAAKRRIRTSDLDRRADPTIGIKGGVEDGNALIGLRVEMPLHVRNDFSEQVAAMNARALMAEREAQDAFRNVQAGLRGAGRRLTLTLQALTRWRDEGQPLLTDYSALLERLWRAGEIGSTEYLVQLGQALDTRIAGEGVRGKAWRAWADWLSASGGVQEWLGITVPGGER